MGLWGMSDIRRALCSFKGEVNVTPTVSLWRAHTQAVPYSACASFLSRWQESTLALQSSAYI